MTSFIHKFVSTYLFIMLYVLLIKFFGKFCDYSEKNEFIFNKKDSNKAINVLKIVQSFGYLQSSTDEIIFITPITPHMTLFC